MHSAILRSLHSCLGIDYFGFQAQARPKSGPQGSVTGFAGTVLLLVIFIAFAVSNFITFLNMPAVTTTTRTQTMPDTTVKMVPTCIEVPHINNPLWFYYDFEHVEIYANGTKEKHQIILDRTTGADGDGMFCISSKAIRNKMRGFCAPGNCAYIQMHLWTCGANDTKNPTRDWTNCTDYAAIKQVLDTQYVTATFNTSIGQTKLNTAPKIESSCLFTSSWIVHRTTKQPDLLRSFTVENWTDLEPDKSTYALQYFWGDARPFAPVLVIKFLLQSYRLETMLTHPTIFDEISRLGAFWNTIASVLAIVFIAYNEKKFFERHPLWNRIDGNFDTVPLPDEMSDRKKAQERFRAAALWTMGDANHAVYVNDTFGAMTADAAPR